MIHFGKRIETLDANSVSIGLLKNTFIAFNLQNIVTKIRYRIKKKGKSSETEIEWIVKKIIFVQFTL